MLKIRGEELAFVSVFHAKKVFVERIVQLSELRSTFVAFSNMQVYSVLAVDKTLYTYTKRQHERAVPYYSLMDR